MYRDRIMMPRLFFWVFRNQNIYINKIKTKMKTLELMKA